MSSTPRTQADGSGAVRQRGLYSDLHTAKLTDATSGPKYASGGMHETAAQLISASTLKGPLAPPRAPPAGGSAAPAAPVAGGGGSMSVDGYLAHRKQTQLNRRQAYTFTSAVQTPSDTPQVDDGSPPAAATGVAAASPDPRAPISLAGTAPAAGAPPAAGATTGTSSSSSALPPSAYLIPLADAIVREGAVITSGIHAGVPVVALEPKVFVPKARAPGAAPRLVEIERRKRQYVTLHAGLPAALASQGIRFDEPGGEAGVPSAAAADASTVTAQPHAAPAASHAASSVGGGAPGKPSLGSLASRAVSALPLAAFDDDNYEIRDPAAWLQLGVVPQGAAAAAAAASAGVASGDVAAHRPHALPGTGRRGSVSAAAAAAGIRLDGTAAPGQYGVPAQALFITAHKPALAVGGKAPAGTLAAGASRRRAAADDHDGAVPTSGAAAGDGERVTAYSLTSGYYTGNWRQCRVMAYDNHSQLYTVIWAEASPAGGAGAVAEGGAGDASVAGGGGAAGGRRARVALEAHIAAGRTLQQASPAPGAVAVTSDDAVGTAAGAAAAAAGLDDAAGGELLPTVSLVSSVAMDAPDDTSPSGGADGAAAARSVQLKRMHGMRGGDLHDSDAEEDGDAFNGLDTGKSSNSSRFTAEGGPSPRSPVGAGTKTVASATVDGSLLFESASGHVYEAPSAIKRGSSFFESHSLASVPLAGADGDDDEEGGGAAGDGGGSSGEHRFPRASWVPLEEALAAGQRSLRRFRGPCPVPVPPGMPVVEAHHPHRHHHHHHHRQPHGAPEPRPAWGWALVPRLHLCFLAESPETFVQRVTSAVAARRAAAGVLRYHLVADCMPQDLDLALPAASVDRLAKRLAACRHLRSYLAAAGAGGGGGGAAAPGAAASSAAGGSGASSAAAVSGAGGARAGPTGSPSHPAGRAGALGRGATLPASAVPPTAGGVAPGGLASLPSVHASVVFGGNASAPGVTTTGSVYSVGVAAAGALGMAGGAGSWRHLPDPIARLLAEAAADYRRTMNAALLSRALAQARAALADASEDLAAMAAGDAAAAAAAVGAGGNGDGSLHTTPSSFALIGDSFGRDTSRAPAALPPDAIRISRLPAEKLPVAGRASLGGMPSDTGLVVLAAELAEGIRGTTGKPASAAFGAPSHIHEFLALPNAGAPGSARAAAALAEGLRTEAAATASASGSASGSGDVGSGTCLSAVTAAAARRRTALPAYDYPGQSHSFAFQTLYSAEGSVAAIVRVLGENQKLMRSVAGLPYVGGAVADIQALWNTTGAATGAPNAPSPAAVTAAVRAWLQETVVTTMLSTVAPLAGTPAGASTAAGGSGMPSDTRVGGPVGAAGGGGGGTAGGAGVSSAAPTQMGGASAASLMSAGTLFATGAAGGKTSRVEEFEHTHSASIAAFSSYLREGWAQSIRNHVRACFASAGKGNFNLKESDAGAYAYSKLRRFLRMLNMRMADQLRYAVDVSLKDFALYVLQACSLRVEVGGTNVVTVSLPRLTAAAFGAMSAAQQDPRGDAGASRGGRRFSMALVAAVSAAHGAQAAAVDSGASSMLITSGSGVTLAAGASGGVILGGKRRTPLFTVDLVMKEGPAPVQAAAAPPTPAGKGGSTPRAGAGAPTGGAAAGKPAAAAGGKAGAKVAADEEDAASPGKTLADVSLVDLEAAASSCGETPYSAMLPVPLPVTGRRSFAYSVPVEAITAAPLSVIDRALKSITGVLQVERQVMEKLFWPTDPTIPVVYPFEPHVAAIREYVAESLEAACAPLREYLVTYEKYAPIINMDVEAFTALVKAKYAAGGFNLAEAKATVARHRAAAGAIMEDVPSTVHLGLVQVNVAEVRATLARKHREVAEALLRLMAQQAIDYSAEVTKAYDAMIKQLGASTPDIEGVVATREFMASVPDKVKEQRGKLDAANALYDALDAYGFALQREQFDSQWKAAGGALRVYRRLAEVDASLDSQKGRFLDEMAGEQAEFEEHLNALASDVQALGAFLSLDQVSTVAPIVAKLRNAIAAADEKSKLFNAREALFNKTETSYEKLVDIKKAFEPFQSLWETAANWVQWQKAWMNGPFMSLNAELIEREVGNASRTMARSVKAFERLGIEGCLKVARQVRDDVDTFRPNIPLITALRNPGMRERHWTELSEAVGTVVDPERDHEKFTLATALGLRLADHIDVITKIGEKAGKEYQIETALAKMHREWEGVALDILPYRETGTYLLRGVDVLQSMLDEHTTMTQAMTFSAFKKPFAEDIERWAETLNTVSDVLEEWMKVQRSWMYLQPIFDSPDIQKQLPTEYKRFSTVDKNWRTTLLAAKGGSAANSIAAKAITFCANEKLLERFTESNKFLELVQKGLSDYLETKRSAFARFYFLSNDELLEILSQTKDPKAVQPHLKKCFEGMRSVVFDDATSEITAMLSGEKERVELASRVDPRGKNVEHWMSELESAMMNSVRCVMYDAVVDYTTRPRNEWTQVWPGQCVLNASQLHWTREIEDGIRASGAAGVQACYEQQLAQLRDMVVLIRTKLPPLAKMTLGSLTVIDVHARDVTKRMADVKVSTLNDFEWISNLRYYWVGEGKADGNMTVQMVSSIRPYGYEYLGNSLRLVITPLTDKCYLTLMGALQVQLGGAPAGPAGTGKTETTKDLAKALAKQCVVFNCSDGLDYLAMGKFFKGLASCGAWACFDEFNRIDVEVLSVVAQQLLTLQDAVKSGAPRIMFEGSDISVNPQYAAFITMNPGYAGRTELPDNLKALFRPVAMMVPDYALIGEIMLFSFGFEKAQKCARKMVATFKLCSEQLSSQDHYDYGMRAVKTVITAAGNLKTAHPDEDEEMLLYRALQDVNVPKFLSPDLPLFRGIMSDLFPGIGRPNVDYGDLETAISASAQAAKLQPVPNFVTKCIQVYETVVVRHGMMVVGPTGGGKSSMIRTTAAALTSMAAAGKQGPKIDKVLTHTLNPKSITMDQLYGGFDPNTHEWTDGILARIVRDCASTGTRDLQWVVFDGPVDAIWIENMNTVLDDNKKLCLVSGEIIGLSNEMTIMFEVEDLAVASPATVSRCGMVFQEPQSLGIDVLLTSWLEALPAPLFTASMRTTLATLFETYLKQSLYFLRRNLSEPVPTVDNQLVRSLLNILLCFFEPYLPKEGRDAPTKDAMKTLEASLSSVFIFALLWSVGATTNAAGRKRFNAFLRGEMESHGLAAPAAGAPAYTVPPPAGMLYDHCFDLTGALGPSGAAAVAAGTALTPRWMPWMSTIAPYEPPARGTDFSELIIPTKDSVRYKFLAKMLLSNRRPFLMAGDTGTGKTVSMNELLASDMSKEYVPVTLTFSAQTSANQTQDLVDGKLERRGRGMFGPTAGNVYVLFIDDLNMPQKEKYGAQPPIELLRQFADYGGWYDRKERTFRRVVDTVLLAAMGPPGGGRNPITARFVRHFNVVTATPLDDESLHIIFDTILNAFVSTGFTDDVRALAPNVVSATINVYNTIAEKLLPTPSKPHYTFNLRDLGKVFQGMLMGDFRRIPGATEFARMWVHECRRVFADRLVNGEDKGWFDARLKEGVEGTMKLEWDAVVPPADVRPRLLYGDYMVPGADPKIYAEVDNIAALQPTVEEYLSDYNAESKTPMKLVMFLDAIDNVSRLSRILRQPQGNALLLGVGGSGRQSLTRLAAFMADFALTTIEISKGYGKTEWRDDLKRILMKAGIEEKPVVFLFNDTQIVFEGMLEDVNNILNSGDVPNLYSPEDMDAIITACRQECVKRRLPPTKINIFAQYLLRVRRNIHVVLCMSPMGDAFRNRVRMFPALVNCCTINWFSDWPEEALRSVAMSALTEENLQLGDHLLSVVEFFTSVHTAVAEASKRYAASLRRYNYVTPTSYLELLTTFKTVLQRKRDEVGTLRSRLQTGLDKISSTEEVVSKLQDELVAMQPKLASTQEEVAAMIVQLTKDKAAAAETKAIVEKEEAKAQKEAAETKAIADDAQADLNKALPALEAAADCLNSLEKKHFDEVRALRNPPQLVKTTIEAACIMFNVKPKMVNDPANPMKKIKDYWAVANTTILADAKKLLTDLKEFDKDNIPDATILEVQPYVEDPDFTFENVGKASKACQGICMWVRAMYTYYHVAKEVEPKKAKLKAAQEKLDETMEQLEIVKGKLAAVMRNIDELEARFNEANARKEQLASDVALCAARLDRAHKLIGGLGGEKDRWSAQVAKLTSDYTNLIGDALVSSSTIAYLGAFTAEFRRELVESMHTHLTRLGLPHTVGCNVMSTLADPVQVRAWNLAGLPTDTHSVENGIIMARARRWPLLIDPQGQANRFVRNMGKDKSMAENGLEVLRQSDKRFLQTLENAIRFGRWCIIENVGETLDAALEPVLLKLVFKQGGSECIRLGDSVVPYSSDFRLFLTTSLPNPHYAPEVQVKVSLLNFTITPQGLEDQLLGVFVVNELPELEDRKNALMLANARNRKELADIENRILYLLSNSTGNILDDEELIETLSSSKVKSNDISAQVKEAEVTEREIDATRGKYRPVAFRASILYFCITDLASVDPMYQYSLPWFSSLFVAGIKNSKPSDVIATRIENLNSYFTASIYRNVCRSLFERHKLLFSFLMAIKILQGDDKVDAAEWRFLISGQVPAPPGDHGHGLPHSPDPSWITERMWAELLALSTLPTFAELVPQCVADAAVRTGLREMFDSNDSHRIPLPGVWATSLNSLQKMCVLRCIRPDKLMLAVQDFVIESLGKPFVEPPPFDIGACYEDSTVTTPLIFVLSAGSDPTRAFYQFAESAGMRSKVEGISLGQGQGALATQLIANAQLRGQWVLLQNCHLAASWMGDLERIVESIDAERVSKDFRLWLTSMPSKSFPVSVLQNGVKMTNEPPMGLRANLRNFFYQQNDDALSQTEKPAAFRKLLFGLAFFHAVVQERKRFGPLGWNRPYDFNNSDLDISMRQLTLFLDEYAEIPYRVLHTLTSYINYGGRVTDDKDSRTIDVILRDYFTPSILTDGYAFTPSGVYYSPTVEDDAPLKGFMDYVDGLPLNAAPEVFGMHPNANITCDTNETDETLDIIVSLQPRTAGGGGKSRDTIIGETARDIASKLPEDYDIEAISTRYPVLYEESMNTVLVQECIRYNKLLAEMKRSLADIQKALTGLVVMSKELDEMGTALHANKVPQRWEDKAYPSLKPLSAWVVDLTDRLRFIGDWVQHGPPAVYWISGFFFPQAFLTGTLQNYARKAALPIDTLSFNFLYLNKQPYDTIASKPVDGCYIRGLYLEGARYDEDAGQLADSLPKQLYTQLPVMHLLPVPNRTPPTSGVYLCPVYKILSRWGVLATTGHSSNFVIFIEIPTDKPTILNNVGEADCAYWIKAGVAAFTSLKF